MSPSVRGPVLLVAIFLGAGVARAGEGTAAAPVPAVQGRLLPPSRGGTLPEIAVGDRRYGIAGDDAVAAHLAGLVRAWVSVVGTPVRPGSGGGPWRVTVAGPEDVVEQARGPHVGVVRAVEGERGAWAVETRGGTVRVPARDARRLAPFAGRRVSVEAWLTADAESASFAEVRRVSLAPGERDPGGAEAAVTGHWTGTITATEVPRGVPAQPGDYPIELTTGEGLEEVHGRLMGTFDVVGLTVRGWRAARRELAFDLAYDFGGGSTSVRFTGTFAVDWRVLEGTWTSSFLGRGTFRLVWVEPPATDAEEASRPT